MYQEIPHAAEPLPGQILAGDELEQRARAVFPSTGALTAMLDHTLLKPQATQAQVITLCEEATAHGFACAMVNPVWVSTAAHALAGTGVRVGTVLGFPLGASLITTKQQEALATAKAGALDLDVVLHVGSLVSGLFSEVREEVHSLAQIAHGEGALLKVILETCLLTDEQKRVAAQICADAGADFVKTSTGFSTGGATIADVRLLRDVVGQRCGVKASGGIRSLADAVQMAEAGANRIGASASVAIVEAYRPLETR